MSQANFTAPRHYPKLRQLHYFRPAPSSEIWLHPTRLGVTSGGIEIRVGGTEVRAWKVSILTAITVKNAAPRDKDFKLSDSAGLLLYVSTSGHRSWRFKYRFGGKEKRLILGAFPEMSLADARERRDEVRRLVKEGQGPKP